MTTDLSAGTRAKPKGKEEVFQVKPEEIRDVVKSMWLTTPEAELLGCIALALAEILQSLISCPVAPAQNDDGSSISGGCVSWRP